MFSKLSTRTLLILMAVLAVIVWLTYRDSDSESTFRTVFMELDTARVTGIRLYPKAQGGEEIRFDRKEGSWDLSNGSMTTAADTQAVRNLLREFAAMNARSLAANTTDQWPAFQVDDTSATRIKFITPGKTWDVMVGKFGYNEQTRGGITYVRMHDEDEVYSVEGFLSFTVNQVFNAWRNRNLTRGGHEQWKRIVFSYPGDSSFMMTRDTGGWHIDGMPCDAEAANSYVTSVANLNSNAFLDGYHPGPGQPAYSVRISGDNATDILIRAFPADTGAVFALHSSLVPDAWFNEKESSIVERLFVSRSRFLTEKE